MSTIHRGRAASSTPPTVPERFIPEMQTAAGVAQISRVKDKTANLAEG